MSHYTRVRVMLKFKELRTMTKHDIAKLCFISAHRANEILREFRKENRVHIAGYVRLASAGAPTKVWSWGPGRDAKKPRPKTGLERRRKARSNPETCIREMLRKRSKRLQQKLERESANV